MQEDALVGQPESRVTQQSPPARGNGLFGTPEESTTVPRTSPTMAMPMIFSQSQEAASNPTGFVAVSPEKDQQPAWENPSFGEVSTFASDEPRLGQGEGLGGDDQYGLDSIYNDYAPIFNSTFSFTSFAFPGSPDFLDQDPETTVPGTASNTQPAQPWGPDVSGVGTLAESLPVLEYGNSNTTDPRLDQSNNTRRIMSRPGLAVSPPLLSTAQQKTLLDFFDRCIQAPASLVGVDPLGWMKINRYVLQKAKDGNESVAHALFAISTLLSAPTTLNQPGSGQDNHKHLALRLHEAACIAIKVNLWCEGWETRNSQALLAAVFLLAWFEVSKNLLSLLLVGRTISPDDFSSRSPMTMRTRHVQLSPPT